MTIPDHVAAAVVAGLTTARWPSGQLLVDVDDQVLTDLAGPLVYAELAARGLLTPAALERTHR